MENKTKKTALFGSIAALLAVVLTAGAFAMPFGFDGQQSKEERLNSMHNEDVRTAIEQADYNAYLAAIDSTWSTFRGEMTEERFQEIVAKHEERAERKAEREKQKELVHQAIEEENYDEWVSLIDETRFGAKLSEKITEDNFATYIAMHEAMQEKDFATATELASQLDIDMTKSHGKIHAHKHERLNFANE